MTKPTYIPFPDITGVPDGPEVARIAYDWLTKHPEQHDQDVWLDAKDAPYQATAGKALHCGTTACIGGLVGLMDGWTWRQVLDGLDSESSEYPVSISDHAAERLGLSFHQAHDIFYSYDNAEALEALLHVANGTYPADDEED